MANLLYFYYFFYFVSAVPFNRATNSTKLGVITTPNDSPVLGYIPQFIGTFKADSPGFIYSPDFNDKKQDLFISSFHGQPWSQDMVYHVPNVGSKLKSIQSVSTVKLSPSMNWPNGIMGVPAGTFGQKEEGIIVSAGFLAKGGGGSLYYVPRKSDGSMGTVVEIYHDASMFYHRTLIMDVDKDGQMDLLTCRAQKNGPKYALTYLTPKNRKTGSFVKNGWVEHVIMDSKYSCDTYFELVDLNGDGEKQLVVSNFWGQNFGVISSNSPDGKFSDSKFLEFNMIDDTIGKAFDLEYVDLNGDGQKDFIVTNHQGNSDRPEGSVYAFTLDRKKGYKNKSAWNRHTLATGFKNVGFLLIGAGTPGTPKSFFPNLKGNNKKPAIILAGDDAQHAYILAPLDQNESNWNYSVQSLHHCKGTVGTPLVKDMDGDGIVEIFVPCYSASYIAAYTFSQ